MTNNQALFTLEDASGKEVRRTTVQLPAEYTFYDVKPGRYKAYVIYSDGEKLEAKPKDGKELDNATAMDVWVSANWSHSGGNGGGEVKKTVSPPDRLPLKAIICSAIGISLLSHFGGAEPLIREISKQLVDDLPSPRSSQRTQPRNDSQSRNPQSQIPYSRLFSPSVETRLRACIQSNFVRLSEIPTLSGLLETLSWEREPSGEFERQLIIAYTKVQQLQAMFEECDLTLVQEILAAQQEVATSDFQFQEAVIGIGEAALDPQAQAAVVVVGELVNIRVGPNDAILWQVSYGTTLLIDQETLALLSSSERLAIKERRGWLPIFIPGGRRGYIFSLYIS